MLESFTEKKTSFKRNKISLASNFFTKTIYPRR